MFAVVHSCINPYLYGYFSFNLGAELRALRYEGWRGGISSKRSTAGLMSINGSQMLRHINPLRSRSASCARSYATRTIADLDGYSMHVLAPTDTAAPFACHKPIPMRKTSTTAVTRVGSKFSGDNGRSRTHALPHFDTADTGSGGNNAGSGIVAIKSCKKCSADRLLCNRSRDALSVTQTVCASRTD